VCTDRNHFGCRFQRGELRSRRFVLHAPEPPPINSCYGQHFIQADFTGIHILKKGDRIGNLIMLAAANVEAAFKSR